MFNRNFKINSLFKFNIKLNLLSLNKYFLIVLFLCAPPFAFADVTNAKLYGDIDFSNAKAAAKKINNLKKGDILELKINSKGGIVEAGDVIRKAIRNTQGKVVAVIEKRAYSEGAFIAIACHEVKGKGQVMFHVGYQYDDEGNHVFNPRSWGHKQAITMTRSVLTKKEHYRMAKLEEDVYMSVDTLKQRLKQKKRA